MGAKIRMDKSSQSYKNFDRIEGEPTEFEWNIFQGYNVAAQKRFQYCNDASGTIVYFQALQGHSGRNLIDPSLKDNIVIPSNVFQHIYLLDVRSICILSLTLD